MDSAVDFYFDKGLANSTQKSYLCGFNRYLQFCRMYTVLPVPVTEQVLCRFVSYLASQGLKHRTIKVYLSGIRYFQIKRGQADVFRDAQTARLEYVLRGVKRHESEQGTRSRPRLPITPEILRRLKATWSPTGGDVDTKMMWAACCLGFFAFLRAGEMTVPSDAEYDPGVLLSIRDVALDSSLQPSLIRVTIKQSKTDPFRQGVDLFVGKTGTDLCPVAALLDYLVLRGTKDGPLFLYSDGRFLTRQRLVESLRAALERAGVDQSKYCSHSLRIGAATTAASKGMEDSVMGSQM